MSEGDQRQRGAEGLTDSLRTVPASEVDWCPRCDLRIDTCPPDEHGHAFAWDIVHALAGGLDRLDVWCDTARLRSDEAVGWKPVPRFVQHPQDEARTIFLWDEGVMATTRDDLLPVRW